MLDHIDGMLRHLLLTQVAGLSDETQVGFRAPDDDWRKYVSTLAVAGSPASALNVYLVDLRERRELRRPDWTTTIADGVATRAPAPARLDCHYLLTAWSPAISSPAVEPALDEHHLLYEAVAALFANVPLNATRIYGPGTAALAALPELLRDTDLPMTVVPPEGFAALPYFWGALGTESRWRAAAYVVVTVPVLLPEMPGGPLVTTELLELSGTGGATAVVTDLAIGGTLSSLNGDPVAAWLRLETLDGHGLRTTSSGNDGRFSFSGVRPGSYRLRVRPPQAGEHVQEVTVPSATGGYDVTVPGQG